MPKPSLPPDDLASMHARMRRMAHSMLDGERRDHTLQPTALVNEALLRLLPELERDEPGPELLGMAARVMREVLVDHARRRNALKRGAGWRRVTLSEVETNDAREVDIAALDQALSELAIEDERCARVVELTYFGGLSADRVAECLAASRRTVVRELQTARPWLLRRIDEILSDQ